LTTKLHLRVIGNGLSVQIELSPGQMNDQPMAELLLNDLPAGADVIADKGYDADWIRDLIEDQDCTPHIPPKSNSYDGITYSKKAYKKRNLIERCFNKLKQFRHIATREALLSLQFFSAHLTAASKPQRAHCSQGIVFLYPCMRCHALWPHGFPSRLCSSLFFEPLTSLP
jgi:transposase